MADQQVPSQTPQVLPVACEQCRRSKRKCDRVAPQCGSCSKASRKCTMPDVLEQPTDRTKRQRMPKGFVEILEGRVQQLEDSIQKHLTELQTLKQTNKTSTRKSPRLSDPRAGSTVLTEQNAEINSTRIVTAPDEGPGSTIELTSTPPVNNNTDVPLAQSSSSSQDIEDAYPLSAEAIVSLSKMSESNEYGLFNSTSVAYAMLAADGGSPFGSSVLRSNIFQDDSHISQDLGLSKMLESFLLNQGEALLSSYEKSCHVRHPFMEMGNLRRMMEICKARGGLEPIQSESVAARFHFFTVMAIGLAMEGRRISFAGQIEGNLFMVAVNHLGGIFRFSDAIDQIRALLLLTIYSMFRSSTGSTWHLAGFAMRICIAHSYHIGEHPENIYKTFWSAFMLEQMICNALERLPSLGYADLLIQPCCPSSTPTPISENSSNVHEEIWTYWVTRSQLHAKLNLNPGIYSSSVQNAFSVYQLKVRQPRLRSENASLETLALRKDLDQEYLCDLVSFIARIISAPSSRFDQFCLFVSTLTIHRLASSNPPDETLPSWPTAILIFRAGLICLRSIHVPICPEYKDEVNMLISDSIRESSDYLSRLCGEFRDLTNYRVVFDSAVSLHERMTKAKQITGWNMHPETPSGVASLPTIIDQQLAKQTFESIQAHSINETVFDSGVHAGLKRLVSCISYESDEERRLYDGIFSHRN